MDAGELEMLRNAIGAAVFALAMLAVASGSVLAVASYVGLVCW